MRDDPNFKHYTRGGQISFHNLRMWDQITKSLTFICLFLWLVFTGLISWSFVSVEKLQHASIYYYAQIYVAWWVDALSPRILLAIPRTLLRLILWPKQIKKSINCFRAFS